MPYYLTKELPLLFMPIVVAMAAALLALFFIIKSRRKPAIFFLLTSLLVLWVSSLPVVASRLLWSLQRQHLPISIEDIPSADCIVLLGGALGLPLYPRVDIELTDATDRVYQTAKLWQYGKGETIIVAAGNQPWTANAVPEAKLIRELLVEWGVSRQSVVMDTASKNTRENAINAAALMSTSGCQTGLLVTSASHMPRALASFEKVGLTLFPVSVDLKFVPSTVSMASKLIPRADALAITSQAIHEWMGIWIYRFRGWN